MVEGKSCRYPESAHRKEQCAHCGKPGHKWYECRGKITISAARKGKAAIKKEEEEEKCWGARGARVFGVGSDALTAPQRVWGKNER